MAEPIVVDNPRTTTREAILQRTTRGMLTFNTGKVHRLEGELWAVPSTRGGFHQVDLGTETCDCEDFTFYGSAVGVACRHVYAAAIAHASEARRRVRHTCAVCGEKSGSISAGTGRPLIFERESGLWYHVGCKPVSGIPMGL